MKTLCSLFQSRLNELFYSTSTVKATLNFMLTWKNKKMHMAMEQCNCLAFPFSTSETLYNIIKLDISMVEKDSVNASRFSLKAS